MWVKIAFFKKNFKNSKHITISDPDFAHQEKAMKKAGSCPHLELRQILGGDKVLKAIFLIKGGQNWVVKGGHFSVINSMRLQAKWF